MIPARKLLKYLSIFVLTALLCCVLFIAWLLGSEKGRLALAHFAVNKVNESPSLHISIEQLAAPSLGEWQADKIEIYKSDQLWVQMKQCKLQWEPKPLFTKRLIINNLSAHKIKAFSVTEKTDEVPNTTDTSSSPITFFNALVLQHMNIAELDLRDAISPINETAFPLLKTEGNIEWARSNPVTANFDIQSQDNSSFALTIKSTAHNLTQVDMEGSLQEAPAGYIGTLLQLPEAQKIDAGFHLSIEKQEDTYLLDIGELFFPISTHNFNLTSSLKINPEVHSVYLDSLELKTDKTEHFASGKYEDGNLDFDIALNDFPLDIFDIWLTKGISGELGSNINISGNQKNPNFSGKLSSSFMYQETPVTIEFDGVGNRNAIKANHLLAGMSDAKLEASGDLDILNQHIDVKMLLQNFNIELLSIADIELPAHIQGTIDKLDANVSGNWQHPENLKGKALLTANGSYKSKDFSLNADLSKPENELFIDNLKIQTAEGLATVKGSVFPRELTTDILIEAENFSLEILNTFAVPVPPSLSVNINTSVKVKGEIGNPEVTGTLSAAGNYDAIPFELALNGNYSNNETRIENFVVNSYDQEVFSAQGLYKENNYDFKLRADRFPSKLLTALGWYTYAGNVSSEMHVYGDLNDSENIAQINGHILYDGVLNAYDENSEKSNIPFLWKIDINSLDKVLHLNSEFTRNKIVSGDLKVSIPMYEYITYVMSGGEIQKSATPLKGKIVGSMDLQTISLLFDPDINQLRGTLESSIALGGTLDSPEVNGDISIRDGYYKNAITGTTIQNLLCSIGAEKTTFTIGNCSATDEGSGKYSLSGDLAFADNEKIDITLQAMNANILRTPSIESETSGEIKINGNLRELSATGELEISPLTAMLDATMDNSIPKLKVEEVYAASDADGESKNALKALPRINLDLLITSRQQAYLRGRGLEAELRGELTLKGTTENPIYDGEFHTVRGVFEFFGKKFKLEEGQINVANDALALSIPAVYEKNGQLIRAVISSVNNNLKISLSAVPEMPEDEILAFIIFGKSIKKMSPFEAIQLANAVQTLRGESGNFFDPVSTARDALGADTLYVESAESESGDSGVNIGVGKYLNEKVYLELEHTPDPSQPWKGKLDIELMPNLGLESSTGGETGIDGVELKWKKDY